MIVECPMCEKTAMLTYELTAVTEWDGEEEDWGKPRPLNVH